MIQKDYFLRTLEEFINAIARLINKDIKDRTDEELQMIYNQYVGDFDLLRNFSIDEAIEYAKEQWDDERRIPKLEMLAELWYAESTFKQHPLSDMLLDKALKLFIYVDQNSSDFSIDRKNKIGRIQSMINRLKCVINKL